jgi:hypothetical protein
MADTSLPPHYKTRGLAALSTSLRLTQEAARKALRADDLQPEATELPELVVRELSQHEIEELRHKQATGSAFDPPETTNSGENEIIEEGG